MVYDGCGVVKMFDGSERVSVVFEWSGREEELVYGETIALNEVKRPKEMWSVFDKSV
jgi:hypothetical protein